MLPQEWTSSESRDELQWPRTLATGEVEAQSWGKLGLLQKRTAVEARLHTCSEHQWEWKVRGQVRNFKRKTKKKEGRKRKLEADKKPAPLSRALSVLTAGLYCSITRPSVTLQTTQMLPMPTTSKTKDSFRHTTAPGCGAHGLSISSGQKGGFSNREGLRHFRAGVEPQRQHMVSMNSLYVVTYICVNHHTCLIVDWKLNGKRWTTKWSWYYDKFKFNYDKAKKYTADELEYKRQNGKERSILTELWW